MYESLYVKCNTQLYKRCVAMMCACKYMCVNGCVGRCVRAYVCAREGGFLVCVCVCVCVRVCE